MRESSFTNKKRGGRLLASLLVLTVALATRSADAQWVQIAADGITLLGDSAYCTLIAARPAGFSCDSIAIQIAFTSSYASANNYSWNGALLEANTTYSVIGPFWLPDTLWSMTYRDANIGWAAGDHQTAGGIYETTDGGLSWSLPLTTIDRFRSVCYVQASKRLLACGTNATYSSDDLGKTWSVLLPEHHTNFAFSGMYGVATSPAGQPLKETTDGGFTWAASSLLGSEFLPLAIQGSTTFLALSEDGPGRNGFFRSDDGGKNWSLVHQFPAIDTLAGCVTGDLCRLFIQSANGVRMSTDEGVSWVSLGGPGNPHPAAMWSNGETVVAGTITVHGNPDSLRNGSTHGAIVYKYELPRPTLTTDSLSFTTCEPQVGAVHFMIHGDCHNSRMTSLGISGSSAFRLLDSRSFPDTLRGEDSISVEYLPRPNSTDTATLIFSICMPGRSIDTSVTIFGAGLPPPVTAHLIPSLLKSTLAAGGVTTLSVGPISGIKNQNLNQLTFTIIYDGDLLSPSNFQTSVAGAVLTVGAVRRVGKIETVPLTISGSDLALDPNVPIVTAQMRAFLTDSTSSSIVVSDPVLNGGDVNYRCTLGMSGDSTTFRMIDLCGDRTIRQFLSTKTLSITSVQPNPSKGQFTIEIRNTSGDVKLEVYEVTGKLVLTQSGVEGRNGVDLSGLAIGTYVLRVSDGKNVTSKLVVIER